MRALREAIAAPARERAIEKAALSKAWVLNRLMQLVERTMPPDPVEARKEDAVVSDHVSPSACTAALKLLGQEQGMFIERKVLLKRLDEMSEEELAAVIDEEALEAAIAADSSLAGAEPAGTA